MLDLNKAQDFVSEHFEASVIRTLEEYIRIPNISPAYDVDKTSDAECEKVIDLFVKWVEAQKVEGLRLTVRRLRTDDGTADRTPLIFMEIDASDVSKDADTILLYGHLDKQPPFEGWNEGLGPYTPVTRDGRLYGRGGADDGYAIFGAVLAMKACQVQGKPHSRCVILIEASEESGSPDLPAHVTSLVKDGLMREVSLIVCLDSGCGDYGTTWITTNLRGVLVTRMKVSTLKEGVHSGAGGGICSDSFRVIRQVLAQLEDAVTGQIVPEFQVDIPAHRVEEVKSTCAQLGKGGIWKAYPLVNGCPMDPNENDVELTLNRTWRASLTVIGQDGLPSCAAGGNVLRPSTTLKLSMRLPPTLDHSTALANLERLVKAHAPRDCKIEFSHTMTAPGWNAPKMDPWLAQSLEASSQAVFGRSPAYIGEGGSIPFMGMLGDIFPKAQFIVTGVLGPASNAHGPNEFLDIEYCKKVVTVVAGLAAAHAVRQSANAAPSLVDISNVHAHASARVGGAAEDKLVSEKMRE